MTFENSVEKANILSTPGFSDWFGDCQILDEDGLPLTLYHGTVTKFASFRPSRSGFYGSGIYLTNSFDDAHEFACSYDEDQAFVMDLYVSLQNPFEFYAPNALTEPTNMTLARELFKGAELEAMLQLLSRKDPCKQFQKQLRALGHDGLIVHHLGEHSEYVAFQPDQVKSVHSPRFTKGSALITEPARRRAARKPSFALLHSLKEHLQSACDLVEAGFYFEEGGCFGMALELHDVLSRAGLSPRLFVNDSFVHATVEVDEQQMDYRGFCSSAAGARSVTCKELMDFAFSHGHDTASIASDRAFAAQAISQALNLAQQQRKSSLARNALPISRSLSVTP